VVLALFYLVSAIGSGIAWDLYSFWCFRFLGGLAVGGASVVSPMYIAVSKPKSSPPRAAIIVLR